MCVFVCWSVSVPVSVCVMACDRSCLEASKGLALLIPLLSRLSNHTTQTTKPSSFKHINPVCEHGNMLNGGQECIPEERYRVKENNFNVSYVLDPCVLVYIYSVMHLNIPTIFSNFPHIM